MGSIRRRPRVPAQPAAARIQAASRVSAAVDKAHRAGLPQRRAERVDPGPIARGGEGDMQPAGGAFGHAIAKPAQMIDGDGDVRHDQSSASVSDLR